MKRAKNRQQIRLIAEAIDDDPKMYGSNLRGGASPIDLLIAHVQKNMIKWDWNNNKFIKAMRDIYHAAGKTVPTDKEQLVQDLQKDSEQDPKLLSQLIAALGGMSRRHFMGLTAGAGVGAATGMIDLKGHDKSKAADWDGTLKEGEHYHITYRNWKNQTRVWKDLIYSHMYGQMYWFQDPNKPLNMAPRGPARQTVVNPKAIQFIIRHSEEAIKYKQAILAGRMPMRRDKYVRANWVKTIDKLKHSIHWHEVNIKTLKSRLTQAGSSEDATRRSRWGKHQKYKCITLQVENIVDIAPVGKPAAAPAPAPKPEAPTKPKRFGLF